MYDLNPIICLCVSDMSTCTTGEYQCPDGSCEFFQSMCGTYSKFISERGIDKQTACVSPGFSLVACVLI